MIRRSVGFNLEGDGTVTPSIPQYGGVKGEHNVTTLSFDMNTSEVYEEGDLARLSFCLGDGTVISSDLLEIYADSTNHASVTYRLPQTLTMAGGQLCVRLILSRMDENGNEVEVFRSGEAVLYFDEAPVENGTPFWTGVSEMLKRTVTAKDAAVAAQETMMQNAQESQQAAQTAATHAQAATVAMTAAANSFSRAKNAETAALEHKEAAAEAAQTAGQYAGSCASAVQAAIVMRNEAQEAAEAAQASATQAEVARTYVGDAAMTVFEYNKVAQQAAQAAAKSEAAIKEQLSAVYRFKGSVANVMELDAIADPQVGDVYNVGISGGTASGMNYAWTGDVWDALGALFTVLDEMTGSPATEFGRAVSGYAVAQYVKKALANVGGNGGVALTDDEIIAIVKNAGFARIYFGSGEMPDGYDIQINPDGDTMDDSYIKDMIAAAIKTKQDAFTVAAGLKLENGVLSLDLDTWQGGEY